MPTRHELARADDRYVVALYGGEAREAQVFGRWLMAFWTLDGPVEADRLPDAVGFLGVIGRGLRWHAQAGVVLGYEQGAPGGCYRVPAEAALPPTPRDRDGPWVGWDTGPASSPRDELRPHGP